MTRPTLAVTMGDPAGIGPEITLKTLLNEEIYDICVPLVIGDMESLRKTASMLRADPGVLRVIEDPSQAKGAFGVVDVIDLKLLNKDGWKIGEVSKVSGNAAFRYVKTAIDLALSGKVDAVVTAPINKEALSLAGHPFPGHTEIFAHYCGTEDYAMVLAAGNLRVIHVTTHVSLRDACESISEDSVLRTIKLAKEALESIGVTGRIAVAGLNPHSSEHGIFGDEEEHSIIPAIKTAVSQGIDAEGPVPADTVFVKALAGNYAMVVAMYHDQGHIPVKIAGFKADKKTGVMTQTGGVNFTVGLPVIRTSVDHGTAFEIADKYVADASSMIEAITMASEMVSNRKPS